MKIIWVKRVTQIETPLERNGGEADESFRRPPEVRDVFSVSGVRQHSRRKILSKLVRNLRPSGMFAISENSVISAKAR